MCSIHAEDLCRGVDALTSLSPQAVPVADLQQTTVSVLALIDRLGGWVDLAVAELSGRRAGQVPAASGDGREVPVPAWLRDATTCGSAAAGTRVRSAELLSQLPEIAAAVVSGRIGPASGAVLTRLIGKIDPTELLASQEALIEVAVGRDPQALAVWVRELIATHCEPQLDADERTAQNKRYLQTRNNHDGTIRGSFVLPSGDAESVLTVLEPLARSTGLTDTRNAGQRRADALVEVCEQVLRHGDLPDAGGQRPQLSYVLPADWAAAEPAAPLADILRAEHDGQAPKARQRCATAAWTGPQTRARIETILCDARLHRVLLDPFGQVTGLESLTDNITAAQRRALAARDLGCAARGCTRPPAMCDAHHLISREDGGETSLRNLVLLCRRHHVMWHQGRLQLHQLHVPWLTAPAAGVPPPRQPGVPDVVAPVQVPTTAPTR